MKPELAIGGARGFLGRQLVGGIAGLFATCRALTALKATVHVCPPETTIGTSKDPGPCLGRALPRFVPRQALTAGRQRLPHACGSSSQVQLIATAFTALSIWASYCSKFLANISISFFACAS